MVGEEGRGGEGPGGGPFRLAVSFRSRRDLAERLDAFLTGEPREHITADAEELGICFVAAGHYATETFGVRALGDLLADRFGVEHIFVDLSNPV